MAEKTVATTAAENPAVPSTREESRFLVPPVDIYETADGLTVVADLPGVSREDIRIRVEDNTLTIEAKPSHFAMGDEVSSEYRLLNFFRQFTLGEIVDQGKIEANMRHGVLTLHLPKKEAAKPKQIAVNFEG